MQVLAAVRRPAPVSLLQKLVDVGVRELKKDHTLEQIRRILREGTEGKRSSTQPVTES